MLGLFGLIIFVPAFLYAVILVFGYEFGGCSKSKAETTIPVIRDKNLIWKSLAMNVMLI